jgi:hypothetical protein
MRAAPSAARCGEANTTLLCLLDQRDSERERERNDGAALLFFVV